MSVCLRKLPKIGLSVVPCALRAISIPPLRSGTATPPLLSLPYVRFICFAYSAHYRVFAKQNLAVQPHTTQSYISDFLIISKILAFIRNVRILCNEKHGFYLCFSSRKQTSFDFYDETAASAIRIVLYSIPSGETASRSLSLPLTVIFCPGSTSETFALSNSSPWAQHARTSVIMQ